MAPKSFSNITCTFSSFDRHANTQSKTQSCYHPRESRLGHAFSRILRVRWQVPTNNGKTRTKECVVFLLGGSVTSSIFRILGMRGGAPWKLLLLVAVSRPTVDIGTTQLLDFFFFPSVICRFLCGAMDLSWVQRRSTYSQLKKESDFLDAWTAMIVLCETSLNGHQYSMCNIKWFIHTVFLFVSDVCELKVQVEYKSMLDSFSVCVSRFIQ